MTREEAIKKWDGVIMHPGTHPIDSLVALGLIKLDPPSPVDIIRDALSGRVPFNTDRYGLALDVFEALNKGGFNFYHKSSAESKKD